MLNFPASTNSSGPWARLDSRTGIMFISTSDGDKEALDAPIRTSRGNSRGWNTFINDVKNRAEKDGPITADKWPTIRIDAVNVVKVGQGSSVDFSFTLAPRDKWPSPEGGAAPVAKPKAKTAEPIGEIDEF